MDTNLFLQAHDAGVRYRTQISKCHFLTAETDGLTIDGILTLKHPGPPRWSQDDLHLAWLWDDIGLVQLWTAWVYGGDPVQVSNAKAGVTEFEWSSDDRLAFAQDSDIWIATLNDAPKQLTRGGGIDSEPRFSPSGGKLAFCRDGDLWIYDFQNTCVISMLLPGKVILTTGDKKRFKWSPGGGRLAVSVTVGSTRDIVVIDLDGRIIWMTETVTNKTSFSWLDDDRLHYTAVDPTCSLRTHRLVDLNSGQEEELLREESFKGLKWELPPLVQTGSQGIFYILTPEEWPQLHYFDLTTRKLTCFADSPGDDTAFQEDFMSCSPNGRQIVFSSSRGINPTERRLWIADLEDMSWRPLSTIPGTDCCASFSPSGEQIAYIHCGPYESADVWVTRTDGSSSYQISKSMPVELSQDKITLPTHLTYPSSDGLNIHADLFLPKGFDPDSKYPALIWVHGAMSRQMRYGWHPLKSYNIYYSFFQYLLHQGYIILSVDYRGSSGYGRRYEEASYMNLCTGDLADVVAGADFLNGLGCVHPASIGIFGLSYGGYLTLGALTKYPLTFAVGINIAGVYDWIQYAEWTKHAYVGAPWYGAFTRLDGPKNADNANAWHNASPRNFIHQLQRPLLNLMGTADANVDYAQIEAIVSDCVEFRKDFSMVSYPNETHVFTHRATWVDAFTRIEHTFERYLKNPLTNRSASMI